MDFYQSNFNSHDGNFENISGVIITPDQPNITSLNGLNIIQHQNIPTSVWPFVSTLNQHLRSTSDVTFNSLTLNNLVIDNIETKNIIPKEDEKFDIGTSLKKYNCIYSTNIDSTILQPIQPYITTLTNLISVAGQSINSVKWGYLANLNQSLRTTDNAIFNSITTNQFNISSASIDPQLTIHQTNNTEFGKLRLQSGVSFWDICSGGAYSTLANCLTFYNGVDRFILNSNGNLTLGNSNLALNNFKFFCDGKSKFSNDLDCSTTGYFDKLVAGTDITSKTVIGLSNLNYPQLICKQIEIGAFARFLLSCGQTNWYLSAGGELSSFPGCLTWFNGTDQMILNSNGNLTLGSSNLAANSYKFYCNGSSYFNNNLTCNGNATFSGNITSNTNATFKDVTVTNFLTTQNGISVINNGILFNNLYNLSTNIAKYLQGLNQYVSTNSNVSFSAVHTSNYTGGSISITKNNSIGIDLNSDSSSAFSVYSQGIGGSSNFQIGIPSTNGQFFSDSNQRDTCIRAFTPEIKANHNLLLGTSDTNSRVRINKNFTELNGSVDDSTLTYLYFKNNGYNATNRAYQSLILSRSDSQNSYGSQLELYVHPNYENDPMRLAFGVRNVPNSTKVETVVCDYCITPDADNDINLGRDQWNRWKEIYCVNSSINTSDERLKEVEDTCEGLEFINLLKPIKYRWKDKKKNKGRLHRGLNAQQVKKILDDNNISTFDFAGLCISERKEKIKPMFWNKAEEYDDGLPDVIMGLRYGEFIPICIQAIKDLSKQVDEIKKEIKKMKM
jgi:hypothetical protein